MVAVGWGTLSEGGSLPSTLQQVTLQTISYQASSCNSSIADWHTQLCAGVSGGGKGMKISMIVLHVARGVVML